MFVRLVVGALAIFGLVSLFSSGTATGAGAILLAPLLLFAKVAFFLFLFGMVGRGFGHRSPWRSRPSPGRQRQNSTDSVSEADFEEWHRLSHARDEVDGWVEEVS